eukprot:CAMPEP_0119476612 /NCGR_PEP_ID=MMETSP1344-20130328/7058_1 /TAXON_ID=236787 /ORGANISM="Florenciella parvula, Strain CCMP2471" /LENGTH=563 /DNA_ID=CAMNT_0007510405 /DNA_START=82 /DNA_END=1773 /DNA_ORIENTATION=+
MASSLTGTRLVLRLGKRQGRLASVSWISATVQSPARAAADIDFTDAKAVYASRSTPELVSALMVLQTCRIQPLVTNAEWLLKTAKGLVGASLVDAVVKRTFFAHFCAGEDEKTIRPKVESLETAGIGSILDYAAEADDTAIPSNTAANTAAAAGGSVSHSVASAASTRQDVARKHRYTGEEDCDAHVEVFERCIQSVHNVSPNGFAAIKLTALGPPAILRRMSKAIVEVNDLFAKMDTDNDGVLSREEFSEGYRQYFHTNDANTGDIEGFWSLESVLSKLDPQNMGRIDIIEWSQLLQIEHLPALTSRCRNQGPLTQAVLSEGEIEAANAMVERIEHLAQLASSLQVRLMIDAEQTYFQPAIDNTVINLQERHNREAYTIFNTYQCYLKGADDRLRTDMERAQRRGYRFAAKVVRGAYMVSERELAELEGYESPVHNCLEDTHACYHRAIDSCLDAIASGQKTELMVASHNQRSVEHTLTRLQSLGLDQQCGVYFGQLLGMSDHLTYLLGANSFKAYKYVPYGAVGEVMPYLLRRAQENSSLLGSVAMETRMLRQEITRRAFG